MPKAISHRVVLIRLSHLDDEVSPDALYEASHTGWAVGAVRRKGPEATQVALAVRDGVVAGAWWIDGWWHDDETSRWVFDGHGDAELDEKYLGLDVARWYPKGSRFSVRYVAPGEKPEAPVIKAARASKVAEKPSVPQPVPCPRCFMELPSTGLCVHCTE
ncbi:hypothetical protein [Paraoerskovia marina]|uniref:Uncharacterized protein n=1 Tax=Paraoerskovia marina TaxID=545619 RepID=A0A1H1NWI0_9CELL|nr:hypothetical protein [Paraoerskovia marina]SDS03150.1 hypothetical protein SAMN04489860_0637 [Paraoerskovia marina]